MGLWAAGSSQVPCVGIGFSACKMVPALLHRCQLEVWILPTAPFLLPPLYSTAQLLENVRKPVQKRGALASVFLSVKWRPTSLFTSSSTRSPGRPQGAEKCPRGLQSIHVHGLFHLVLLLPRRKHQSLGIPSSDSSLPPWTHLPACLSLPQGEVRTARGLTNIELCQRAGVLRQSSSV